MVVQAHGDGPRVEGLARRDPRARLQPRREEPRAVDEGPGDPDELLRAYEAAAAEAAALRDQLRDELAKALRGEA